MSEARYSGDTLKTLVLSQFYYFTSTNPSTLYYVIHPPLTFKQAAVLSVERVVYKLNLISRSLMLAEMGVVICLEH